MLPLRNRPTTAYGLSGLLVALLPVAAVAGLVYGGRGLYGSYPASLAGLVGQDVVALAVVWPLLAVSMWLTARDSVGGLFLWGGTLFWIAYYYFFYVVGGFNALFLVYIVTVSASLYGLLSLLYAVDPAPLKERFGSGVPVRLTGGFMVSVALLFAFLWGAAIVSSLAAGTRPDEVTREVAIIDLTVMLPLMFFGGARLWQRAPWGYALAGVLLVKMALSGLTLAFTTALGAWWAREIEPFQAFLFIVFALMMFGAVGLLFTFLRGVGKAGPAFTGHVAKGGL